MARKDTHSPDDRLSPSVIKSLKRWKRKFHQARNIVGSKNLSMYAAGISYFGVLAFFPLVAVVVALAGLMLQPHQLSDAFKYIGQYLPHDVAAMITSQLQAAVSYHTGSALLLAIGVILAIWSVSGAMQNMMTALDNSYEVKETRHWIHQKFVSISLTLGLIVGGMVIGTVFVGGSSWSGGFGVPEAVINWLAIGRWIVMVVGAMLGFSVLYRFGPSRKLQHRRQWTSWGAIIAANAWIAASFLFFDYLQYFGNYSRSYSVYAGIIGLMVWLNYSAYIVLLGAEINHGLEERRHRTSSNEHRAAKRAVRSVNFN